MTLELTRRDALLAAAGGATASMAAVVTVDGMREAKSNAPTDDTSFSPAEIRGLRTVAEAVYPSEVSIADGFVETYARNVAPQRREEMRNTLDTVDDVAHHRLDSPMDDLSPSEFVDLLGALGVDRVGSDPDGSVPERIRYYLVNELLYALFTTPKGSRLVGIDNPVGHPGGYRSYREEPE
jgi:hypothetical protein